MLCKKYTLPAWRSGLTGQRRGWKKSAAPLRSGRQSGRRSGGSFPAWKNWTALLRHFKRMTGTALWNTPRCMGKMISALPLRTGWRLRLENTIPRSREKNGGGGLCHTRLEFINAIPFSKQHTDRYFHSMEFHQGYLRMIQIP